MSKRVFSFHYTLTDKSGAILDSSRQAEPLSFLEGLGQIIPGLEQEILGLAVGDKRVVEVPSEKAYGAKTNDLVVSIPKTYFPPQVEVGQVYALDTEDGSVPARVIKIEDETVLVDANHELAGMDLTFDVEITAIRPATEEELAHGHAHGGDGHHH